MAKKHEIKKARPESVLTLPMAPLLDVVMQILCFFVVTYQMDQPESHLIVNLPGPSKGAPPPGVKVPQILELAVFDNDQYALQKNVMSLESIESTLAGIVEGNQDATVLVKVSQEAKTANLVKVLDLCGKLGLKNLNVMTYKAGI
jgi:biopolymer transport protein ExbD